MLVIREGYSNHADITHVWFEDMQVLRFLMPVCLFAYHDVFSD